MTLGYQGLVFRVKGLRYRGKGEDRKVKFKIQPLYIYRKDKVTTLKKTSYIEKAAKKASKDMGKFYKENAEKRFEKALQK